jgi:hypothetical protein
MLLPSRAQIALFCLRPLLGWTKGRARPIHLAHAGTHFAASGQEWKGEAIG